MDLAIPIVLLVFGFIFFILALYEEREEKPNEDEEEKSDNLVVIFLISAIILWGIGAACFLYVTQSYYSPVTDTIEEIRLPIYEPFMYLGIGFAVIAAVMLVQKIFNILEERTTGG